uniref:Immunoglobulin domain-containing protein n=1 Tax=Oncorhynchus mykiss TaxID=8022 RepID=A0A8C7U759_ONCMY
MVSNRCVLFLISLPFLQSKDVTMVIGEVGGAVTIPCTSDLFENHLVFMYVQRPGSNGNNPRFINGYHTKKRLDPKEYTNRTHVDPRQRTMKLWSILPSDEGLYECHIQYQTKKKQENIQLNVTANYSIPIVTVACDNVSCLVTCSSDSGYPRRDIEWSPNPPLNQSHWRVVNSSDVTDPVSMLFSVYSSISVNCSSGPRLNLSCNVGGALSQEHTVCDIGLSLHNNAGPLIPGPLLLIFTASLHSPWHPVPKLSLRPTSRPTQLFTRTLLIHD